MVARGESFDADGGDAGQVVVAVSGLADVGDAADYDVGLEGGAGAEGSVGVGAVAGECAVGVAGGGREVRVVGLFE